MNRNTPLYAAAALCAGWLLLPAGSQAKGGINLSIDGNAETCQDLHIRTSGAYSMAVERISLPKSGGLSIEGANSHVRVRGADVADYSVEACRIAAAASKPESDQRLQGVTVTRGGNRLASSGPGEDQWMVVFFVKAPRDGVVLDLDTHNGPLSVADVNGSLKVRTENGPISVSNCSGDLQIRAHNGPVSFSGGGGNVSLATQNGPVSIKLAGDEWKGSQFEARTGNGPVSLHVPDGYRSGVRVETGHGPFSCRSSLCAQAKTESSAGKRTVELNGPNPVVRLSTGNGPVSVGGGSKSYRVI